MTVTIKEDTYISVRFDKINTVVSSDSDSGSDSGIKGYWY